MDAIREQLAEKVVELESELAEIKAFASHLGIFRAQEEHNRMIDERDERIAALEALVAMALDLADNGLIDFKKYGLTKDEDIAEKYRAALSGKV